MATTTGALSFAQLRALAAAALPAASSQALDTAAAIALAESAGRPGAVSSTGDYGLWQINHRAHPNYDTGRLLAEPAYNARAMAEISSGGTNWAPWVTFKTGAYKRFLPAAGTTTPGTIQTAAGIGIDDIPTPGEVLDKVDDSLDIPKAISKAATAWIEPFMQASQKIALTALLTAAGLALVLVGLRQLALSSDGLREAAGIATTVAAL